MVTELSVNRRSQIVRLNDAEIRIEYAGMSNELAAVKTAHRIPKVFYVKIIFVELYGS